MRAAETGDSPFVDLVPHGNTLRIERNFNRIPSKLRPIFGDDGILFPGTDVQEALLKIRRFPKVRISQDVEPFLETCRRAACALLHHLGKAKRVLVVTPASLKAEW